MKDEVRQEKQKDIFDKIMHLPVLRIFEGFYQAHKEVLLYLFFGGFAVLVNLLLFALFEYVFGLNELVNNIICWVVCVLLQFFTNRTWVFENHTEGTEGLLKQMAGFFGGRLMTLLVEEIILMVFIIQLQFHAMTVKTSAQIIVILLNYLVSKFWVFKK